ncbi:MAG: 16S rRNA (adenine(1518)-N(6)/adenine(1519)-N(6))-dimethyltransferase RsmA [Patescibacteria group bacterium]
MLHKKSLGQNFLKSESAISAIIDASDIVPSDIVLEIGPGEGVLTQYLTKLAGKVIAIEKDHRLIPFLTEKFAKEISTGKLDVLEKDILEFDPGVLSFYKLPYKVIANIPYYITGQILRMFLETKNQPKSMTLMVQKEVADRILARDNKESLLSLSVKAFGTPKYIKTVKAGSFVPAPNVDSAILLIEDISKGRLGGVDEAVFFQTIHAGFAHKRKQLLPNLSSLYKKENILTAFEKLGISTKIRAEDLPLETWVSFCSIIK